MGEEHLDGAGDEALQQAMAWIRLLAEEIGPRRPTSPAERRAAEAMRDALSSKGLEPALEPFLGYSSFAAPYGLILGSALSAGLLRPRSPRLSAAIGAGSLAAAVAEGGLVRTPVSRVLSQSPSQNLVAAIESHGETVRTVCLVCHLDSSRNGLLFHPGFVTRLRAWIQLQSAAVAVQALAPLLRRARPGRRAVEAAQVILATGLALMLERELRGRDVPGANDNASGAAVAAQLATEVAASPLQSTRIVLLMTGCEESGLLGAIAFLKAHETADWLFLNFDGVGARATLRYVLREGVGLSTWPADPRLIDLAARIAEEHPDLGVRAAETSAGLTYDVSPVLARGGRALTFGVQDRTIPNYHQPSDTYANIDPDSVSRALALGRELLARIDLGEADQRP